jgi:hypothetical protein
LDVHSRLPSSMLTEQIDQLTRDNRTIIIVEVSKEWLKAQLKTFEMESKHYWSPQSNTLKKTEITYKNKIGYIKVLSEVRRIFVLY